MLKERYIYIIITIIIVMGCGHHNGGQPMRIEVSGTAGVNSYLYVLNGADVLGGIGPCPISYASINPDGSLGRWQTPSCDTNLSNISGGNGWAIESSSGNLSVIHLAKNYLYFIVDNLNGVPSNYSYFNLPVYAQLNQDGSLGQFYSTTVFSTGFKLTDNTYFTQATHRVFYAQLVTNNYAYIIGGSPGFLTGTGELYSPPTLYASINSNGSVGTWVSTSSIYGEIYEATPLFYNNRIYLLGNFGSYTYTDINPDGSLAGWNWSNTTNNSFQCVGATTLYSTYIYAMAPSNFNGAGGCLGSNVMEYIPINPDGSLGAIENTTPMNVSRVFPGVIAYNGYIYAIGGAQTGNPNSVEYAPINPDGSVGKWQFTTSLQ
jgi:hypothetical protein